MAGSFGCASHIRVSAVAGAPISCPVVMSASTQAPLWGLVVVFTIGISAMSAVLLALLHHKVVQLHRLLAVVERVVVRDASAACPAYEV